MNVHEFKEKIEAGETVKIDAKHLPLLWSQVCDHLSHLTFYADKPEGSNIVSLSKEKTLESKELEE